MGLLITLQATWLKLDAPGFGTPTNAAVVRRGPLLFAQELKEEQSVVKTWAPLNNTDINITVDDVGRPWNYALELASVARAFRVLAEWLHPPPFPPQHSCSHVERQTVEIFFCLMV